MRITNGPINIHQSRFLRKSNELSAVCISILMEYRIDIRIALNTILWYLYYHSMILSWDTFCYCLVDSSVSIVFNRPKISQKKRPLILHEQFSCCADMDNIVYEGLQNSKYNKKSKWIWFSSITKLFLIKIERDRPLIVLHMAIV